MIPRLFCHFTVTLALLSFTAIAGAGEVRYFAIEVVDDSTLRGVPLVELETINHLRFVTDSNGLVAISEPDLMGQSVYFTVRSHGYEFPKDGFGFQGKAFEVEPGGKGTLKIHRINIAERLYRLTGSGIYRDTVLLGGKAPIEKPLLSAGVFGCDSVMAAIYRGKIHWFWGDTSRPHYPLGVNFHITGATSVVPQEGGLDPAVGVQFDYFVGPEGGVRPMAEMPGEGPTWISAVTVLPGAAGRERMVAGYVKIRKQLEAYQWGFVEWNDQSQRFEKITSFEKRPTIFLEPQTHTLLGREKDGTQYVYFANPLPLTRVKSDRESFFDPERYEGFTCLKAGTVPQDKQLDRGPDGRLLYSWKTNTPPLTQKDQAALVEAGSMKPDEARIALKDVETERAVHAHGGSVYWNDFRKRWILITVELFGESSALGEVWFAEADDLTGPWVYARKIATHDKYSFYNPKHHPFFDQDGGRTIFFEGTYTHSFSGNPDPTPRYDYNQVMYKLDLSAPALNLPVAYYDAAESENAAPFVAKQSNQSAVFFALEHPNSATVAVEWNGKALTIGTSTNDGANALFHGLPGNMQETSATTVPLYEFVHSESGGRSYSVDPKWSATGYRRNPDPICRVWKAPGHADGLADQ